MCRGQNAVSSEGLTVNLSKLIQGLELSLLEPSIRQSRAKLDELLAEEFIEFGMTGKVYNKQDILDCLSSEPPRYFNMMDFEIKQLSSNTILAMYKILEKDVVSLRSSIWKQYGDDWRLLFHQGTKVV